MKKIPLTQGKFAIVDDEDFKYLNQFKWSLSNNRYAIRGGGVLMHRLILKKMGYELGKGYDLVSDHINRDKLDNRRKNLRTLTPRESNFNRGKFGNGIYWHKNRKKWVAQITIKGNQIYLGSFINKENAKRIRIEAENKYFEQFVITP